MAPKNNVHSCLKAADTLWWIAAVPCTLLHCLLPIQSYDCWNIAPQVPSNLPEHEHVQISIDKIEPPRPHGNGVGAAGYLQELQYIHHVFVLGLNLANAKQGLSSVEELLRPKVTLDFEMGPGWNIHDSCHFCSLPKYSFWHKLFTWGWTRTAAHPLYVEWIKLFVGLCWFM